MNLEKIDKIFPTDRVKKLFIFSVILLIIIYPLMGYFFLASNNPGNIMMSQLSFSGKYMKNYYKNIGNLEQYRIGETVDYIFMVAYGSFTLSLAFIIARKFDIDSKWRKFGYILVPGSLIMITCDAIENLFILMMLSDPSNFPDIWAIAHSTFALVKWIIILTAIIYALISLIIKIFKR
ncbi:MAG TPA: hypothetical protein VGB37_08165 [Candidatus Lokiarchaeia archaeon]